LARRRTWSWLRRIPPPSSTRTSRSWPASQVPYAALCINMSDQRLSSIYVLVLIDIWLSYNYPVCSKVATGFPGLMCVISA
jgi:hypothetical protein